MKKSILLLFILLIPVLACSQTSEDFFEKGIAKSNLGDYKGAIQDYNKAIELDPNLAEAYLNRGVAKILHGKIYSGCLDLSKAGELGNMEAYDLIKKYCQ